MISRDEHEAALRDLCAPTGTHGQRVSSLLHERKAFWLRTVDALFAQVGGSAGLHKAAVLGHVECARARGQLVFEVADSLARELRRTHTRVANAG